MTRDDKPIEEKTRRDFIFVATSAVAAGGLTAASWPMIAQMGMASDVKWPTYDVDVSTLEEGQQLLLNWMGKPILIRHRTPIEIQAAEEADVALLVHAETDTDRLEPLPNGILNKQFLVLEGLCPHFGCVPVGEAGDYRGWYCPCHGAHFDTSGRTRKGPPATNMVVPPYKWRSETQLSLMTTSQYHYEKAFRPM